jgi:hypothetical protein
MGSSVDRGGMVRRRDERIADYLSEARQGGRACPFFLGADRPCRRGHVAERFVSGGNCLACLAEYMDANRDKMRAYRAARREANKDKIKAQKAGYYNANRDQLKAKMVEYRVRRAGDACRDEAAPEE